VTPRPILLVLLPALGCTPGADWPRWRGPDGAAVSDAAPLPLRWSATENVAWCTDLPGEGSSSPVVSGGAVFLAYAKRDGAVRGLARLDFRTGAIAWTREWDDPAPERTSAVTGHAAPTPATDGSRVVAFFGNAGVVCVGVDGAPLWRRGLGEFDSELGLASSPVIHGGAVVIVADHDGASSLLALDLANGAVRWETRRTGLGRSWSTPIVVEGRLIVSGQDGLRAYDPTDGRLLWRVEGPEGWVAPSPVSGDGLVYATSGKDGPTIAATPEGRLAWREERGGPYVSSPVFYRGHLYVFDESGRVTVRRGADGAVVHRARAGGKFTSSPAAGDGKVYATDESGTTVVLRAGGGFEILAENRLGEETFASPAIAEGALLIRTGKRLRRIGR
jgi:outer membrane protein assembly factor BamB